jgi:hypothetical protein
MASQTFLVWRTEFQTGRNARIAEPGQFFGPIAVFVAPTADFPKKLSWSARRILPNIRRENVSTAGVFAGRVKLQRPKIPTVK